MNGLSVNKRSWRDLGHPGVAKGTQITEWLFHAAFSKFPSAYGDVTNTEWLKLEAQRISRLGWAPVLYRAPTPKGKVYALYRA